VSVGQESKIGSKKVEFAFFNTNILQHSFLAAKKNSEEKETLEQARLNRTQKRS